MKRTAISILLTCAVVLGFLMGCGRKKASGGEPVAVLAGDTIRAGQITGLLPPGRGPGAIKRRVLQVVLAKKAPSPADTARYREALKEMLQRTSLHANASWTLRQARVALDASRAVAERLDSSRTAGPVVRQIDGIYGAIRLLRSVEADTQEAIAPSFPPGILDDTTRAAKRRSLALFVSRSLQVSPQLGGIIADFAAEELLPRDSVVVSEMVKGIVRRPRRKKRDREKPRPPQLKKRTIDNSMLALRFRTRESIIESISEHYPHLEALYRKQLKIHQNMDGTVRVAFRVDPAGKVMSARIIQSSIREESFLRPFIAYVRTIRFKKIPDKVGPMSFEFPFEFKKT